MAEGDITDLIGINAGTFAGMGGSITDIIIIALIGLTIGGLIVLAYWKWKQSKSYGQIVPIWTIISGKMEKIGYTKARFVAEGLAGDRLFEIKKSKYNAGKILPPPKYRVGNNEWNYFVTESGEWINFSLQNIDLALKEAKAFYSDPDMRLARIAIEKILELRHSKKEPAWKKILDTVIMLLPIIVMIIGLIMIIDKLIEANGATTESMKTARDVLSEIVKIKGGASTGSVGVIPAIPNAPLPP